MARNRPVGDVLAKPGQDARAKTTCAWTERRGSQRMWRNVGVLIVPCGRRLIADGRSIPLEGAAVVLSRR
jgi:hypothetical protein